ncbi:MAG: M24 family metallopeptidase [Planctomycetota bacterium]|jgi:Xaa-Pro aminopeptidase
MNREVIRKRIRAIRRQVKKKRISCLIVTKPANVTYATGFLGDDSWAAITGRQVYLLTDSRYTEQAQKECPSCKIIDRAGPMADAVAALVKKLKSVRTVTVEKSTSVAEFERLKKAVKARLRTAENVIETARIVKDQSEIAAIRAAASISARALGQTLSYIKPGVSESELAGMLDFQIRKLGGRNSFDTIVAFGANASRPHHQPHARKLRKTDTVLIDFGAKYGGYCSDITRCFAVGAPTAFFEKVFDVVEKAQAAAIRKIRAGARFNEVDAAARQTIAETDLPVYGHGTGHGFGLEIHESPFLKADGKGKFQAGQVVTIEPGIYIPGKLGVRIEDDILVTQTGHKILTRNCPHSPLLP